MIRAKPGFFVEKVPSWITSAYLKADERKAKWRLIPEKEKVYGIEFVPVDGPLEFRDMRPTWLEGFKRGEFSGQERSERRWRNPKGLSLSLALE